MKSKNLANFHGKTVIITGGTSGIGYEMVRQLSKDNKLLVLARASERLEKLQSEFPDIHAYAADLSKQSEILTTADKILTEHDHIDVLINNAAVQHAPTFLDDAFSYETIEQEITLNFTAVCAFCYLFLPALLHEKNETVIVNINSGLALAPKTTSAVYCATKAGMNIFSQSLRYQLENTNIRVMQVFLPLVDTPMTRGRGKGKINAEDAAAQIVQGIKGGVHTLDIGKVKLLRFLVRFAPGIAKAIMKRN